MTAYLIVYGRDPSDRLAAHAFETRLLAIGGAASGLVPRVPEGARGGGFAMVVENAADVMLSKQRLADVCRGLAGVGPKSFENRDAGIRKLLQLLPTCAIVAASATHEEVMSEVHEETKPKRQKKQMTEKPPKAFKPPKLGAFSPVRAGTTLAKLLDVVATSPSPTFDAVAAELDVEKAKLNELLRHGLGVLHGISHTVVDGVVSILLPEGKQFDDLIKYPAPKPAKAMNGATPSRFKDEAVITLLVSENPKKAGASSHTRFGYYRSGMTVAQALAAGIERGDLSWDTKHHFISVA